MRHRKALLQQRRDLLLAQPLAPARQRRAIEWQIMQEHHLPAEVLEIRFSAHRSQASDRLCICLRMNRPATSRVGSGGYPGPTRQTELKLCEKRPIDLPRKPHQRVAQVDDLLQGWTKTGRPDARRPAGSSFFPQQRIVPSRESRATQIGNPKTQETAPSTPLSCKIDYLPKSNHRHKSIASEFFTGNFHDSRRQFFLRHGFLSYRRLSGLQ